MLIYIWIRFEWQFSLGAIAAIFHDVIITLGFFSILNLEINLSIVAAVLTIVGYSMNDTVVIFDRVRENLKKFSDIKIFFRSACNLSFRLFLAKKAVSPNVSNQNVAHGDPHVLFCFEAVLPEVVCMSFDSLKYK